MFAALGDPTRLQLVAQLCSGGPESITTLCLQASVSRQAVTKHLMVLWRAGLTRSRRRGRERIWQLEPGRFAVVREYLEQVGRQWDTALERLKTFVEDD